MMIMMLAHTNAVTVSDEQKGEEGGDGIWWICVFDRNITQIWLDNKLQSKHCDGFMRYCLHFCIVCIITYIFGNNHRTAWLWTGEGDGTVACTERLERCCAVSTVFLCRVDLARRWRRRRPQQQRRGATRCTRVPCLWWHLLSNRKNQPGLIINCDACGACNMWMYGKVRSGNTMHKRHTTRLRFTSTWNHWMVIIFEHNMLALMYL